ncbi:sugar phosphate isomerase/epimerase family protein [Maribellus sp. YY47]|uniref:sugar phosphate isomerase/epimerase family protein n=1 Tax=Maribellus sp. YY47 TaxID=2929486 RepID=UPI00200193F7|nr:sugar phosphate isomerase/epimerase family protein [Maribellus sp. YY47]MCK3685619.1 sugar phosphate isomerase/epimerase [Maribellus sp. YY47]
MKQQIFFKSALLLTAAILSFTAFAKKDKAEKAGWQLGVQSYTFHKFNFCQAVDKTQQLGLKNMEVYYGQPLGGDMEGTMDYKMDKATQEKVLNYAKSKGVKIKASGVIICSNEAEWEQLFQFADAMGIEIITCEPEYKHLKYVDELANKYKIDVAIHNHPKPSNYWNPDLFLKAVDGLSNRIGACADVGHWARMGLDPVECLKKIDGRVKSLHFKDIKAKEEGEAEQHDVIWGTGILDIKGMLNELKAQNFKGLFSIEYEYAWENSVPDIEKNISYFKTVTNEVL